MSLTALELFERVVYLSEKLKRAEYYLIQYNVGEALFELGQARLALDSLKDELKEEIFIVKKEKGGEKGG